MEVVANATSGGIAGAVAMTLTCPLFVANTRVQAQRKATGAENKNSSEDRAEVYKSSIDCFWKIFDKEGFRGLFSGLESLIPNAFGTNFIFYFFYAAIKPLFRRWKNRLLANMLVGILSGIGVQLIMTPVDMVNTILMQGKSDIKGFYNTFMHIFKEEGLSGLYKGIIPSLVLCINPGITSMVRIYFTPSDGEDATALSNFLAGARSKAVATFFTYPYVVAKVQMFTENNKTNDCTDSEKNRSERTILGILSRIIKEEGILGPYKGGETQLIVSVMREAILNMVRHPIHSMVKKALLVRKPKQVA